MRMIYGPTKWSCLPACLAMITDLTIETIYKEIGHDGSEIVNPEQPDPYSRRGFEWQEIIKAALTLGIALVEYPDVLELPGILLGTSDNDIPHACAWNGSMVFDPAAGRRPLDSFRHDTFFVALQLSEADWQKFRQTPVR